MNDYYIGVDQNGQPYISHANPLQTAAASVRSAGAGLGRGVRRYHKYLMRIGEGAKARYLYTQQEVQAYMRGGRRALDQLAKNTKENAKETSRKALAAGKQARDRAQNEANKLTSGQKSFKYSSEALAAAKKPKMKSDNTRGRSENRDNTIGYRPLKASERAQNAANNINKKVKETANNVKDDASYKLRMGAAAVRENAQDASQKVKSTSDRMKEEFRKKKDEVKNDVHNKLNNAAWKAAKGLEGADVRKQFEKAADEFIKNPTPENKKKRDDLYDKWAETPHGKFINNEFIAGVQQNGLKDTVKDAVDEGKSRVKDSVKSTSDRMKEEFRKKKDETKEKASNTVNKVKKLLSDEPPKPVLSPAGKEHIETEHIIPEKKIEETRIPEKKIEETRIPEKKIEETRIPEKRLNSKAKYSEYKDDDPDFDENNYSENDRVGDTDFFAFKGADGRTVIIEEDMKWTLPKGIEPDDPAIKEAISKFGDEVSSARSLNMGNYTGDQWTKGATDAINDAIEKAQKRNKKS